MGRSISVAFHAAQTRSADVSLGFQKEAKKADSQRERKKERKKFQYTRWMMRKGRASSQPLFFFFFFLMN